MKKKLSILIALVMAISLCLVPAVAQAQGVGLAGGVYTNSLTLENKDSSWSVIPGDGIGGTLGYNAAGPTFDWGLVAKVQTSGTYALIYYADHANRFVQWGGDNPGKHIANVVADSNGDISASGSKDLGMDLPCPPDANQFVFNYGTDPNHVIYTGDNYATAHGAKIWLVPLADYTAPKLTAWNPSSYLFETDLIWYDDTDVVSNIVAITVAPTTVNFGILTPGTTGGPVNVTVTNSGNVPIDVTALAMPSGNVFSWLLLNGNPPNTYAASLPLPTNFDTPALTIPVPAYYTPAGSETGTLTFVATVQP